MGTGTKYNQAPEWITSDFLQDVLKEFFKDDSLKVVGDIAVEGMNVISFGSEMHRARFALKGQNIGGPFSLIIKDHPKRHMGVVAHKNKLFKREILTYREILPRVNQLLDTIGDVEKIAPACYYSTETPEPFLILEDMSARGYSNFQKGRLLNLEYALLTVKKLAKLHACSAVIAAKDPRIIAFFEDGPISNDSEKRDFVDFFLVNLRCVAKQLSEWKGYEEISKKVLTLAGNVLKNAIEMYESHKKGFRVFNLGDLWINNLMFHYNPNVEEPDDVIMLDYQLTYYGSPAIDLNYFLFGSVNENVRRVHFKYIIHEYHRILKETLEKLNYQGHIPYLKELYIELIQNSLQGVIGATCLTPIIFMESENSKSWESLLSRKADGDKVRKENLENTRYKTFLQRTIKDFELAGFLDK